MPLEISELALSRFLVPKMTILRPLEALAKGLGVPPHQSTRSVLAPRTAASQNVSHEQPKEINLSSDFRWNLIKKERN